MSQDGIMQTLKNNKSGWLRSFQLSDMLGVSLSSIDQSCKRLRKDNFVKFRKALSEKSNRFCYEYKYK